MKREHPFHRWEPIFIGTKQDPLYDEALSWEGFQDKMIQVSEMHSYRNENDILYRNIFTD